MTDFSGLLEAGRLKRGNFSPEQVRQRLRLAERDLATATKLIGEDRDWAFSIAYNAMLQAGRALIFHQGFRPAGEAQHSTVITYLRSVLGEKAGSLVDLMERMRRKRNVSVYDAAGTISSAEAAQAVENAGEFVSLIRQELERH